MVFVWLQWASGRAHVMFAFELLVALSVIYFAAEARVLRMSSQEMLELGIFCSGGAIIVAYKAAGLGHPMELLKGALRD